MTFTTSITPGRYSAEAVTSNLSVHTATVTLTRPSNTTTYTAGDVIGAADTTTAANAGSANLTFPRVGSGGGAIRIDSVDLFINNTTVPIGMDAFRLHLYSIPPTPILDNAAFDLTPTEVPRYLGFVTLATPVDIGSTLYSSTVGVDKVVRMLPYSETLFGELETRGGYIPASGTLYTIKLNTTDVDEATTGSENLLWAYAGGVVPTLDLEFAKTKALNDQVTGAPLVTFTRASSGTFVGNDGVLQTASTDVPRFDHNPTTGESLGLLVEEARTNLLTYSEDVSQWATPFNATLAANSIAAPDGALTADRLLETTATNLHSCDSTAATFVTSTVYTYSVFVNSIGGRNFEIAFPVTIFTARFARFTLSGNGVVQGVDSGVTASIQALANGWYRCSASSTCVLGAGSRMGNFINDASNSRSYTGDITKGIYIWGAQLEAGAFPTSYIPTTTATATRAADVASITGSAFSGWYSQSEGTVFAEGRRDGTSDGRFASIDAGSISNTYVLTVSAARNANVTSVSGGAFGGGPNTSNSFSYQAPIRVAASLSNSQDENICLNGGAVATGNATAPVGPLTTMNIGTQSGASTAVFNGTIRRLSFWPTRLNNATIQQITS